MAFGLQEEQFFVRIGKDDQAELLSLAGAHHLEPMPGRPMMEYIVLPESVTRSPSKLRSWIEKAIEYTATLPPKLKKPVRGKRR
jgi:TfoX/Sxy family transcriptional regulator of competence genes